MNQNSRASRFLESVKDVKVDEVKSKYVFVLSLTYYLRALIFIALIIFSLVYTFTGLGKYSTVNVVIIVLFVLYVIYYLYNLFKYKITIKEDKLIYEKQVVDLKNVSQLIIRENLITRGTRDLCLEIIVENKKYVVRLNLYNKYLFVYLISKISGKKLEI